MNSKYLRGAALVVGSLLIVFTLVDYVALNWPFEPGEIQWRFGALSALGGSLMTPSLGVLLLFAASVQDERRGLRLGVAVIMGFATLGLVTSILVFGLDTIQLRASIRPEALPRYDLESVRTTVKLGFGALAAIVFTVLAFRAWRSQGGRTRTAPAPEAARTQELDTTLIRPSAILR